VPGSGHIVIGPGEMLLRQHVTVDQPSAGIDLGIGLGPQISADRPVRPVIAFILRQGRAGETKHEDRASDGYSHCPNSLRRARAKANSITVSDGKSARRSFTA